MQYTKITKKDGEYRVRLFVDGVHVKDADYFTNDREDAEGTAKAMKFYDVSKTKVKS